MEHIQAISEGVTTIVKLKADHPDDVRAEVVPVSGGWLSATCSSQRC
jgi:hypothetical protein